MGKTTGDEKWDRQKMNDGLLQQALNVMRDTELALNQCADQVGGKAAGPFGRAHGLLKGFLSATTALGLTAAPTPANPDLSEPLEEAATLGHPVAGNA